MQFFAPLGTIGALTCLQCFHLLLQIDVWCSKHVI